MVIEYNNSRLLRPLLPLSLSPSAFRDGEPAFTRERGVGRRRRRRRKKKRNRYITVPVRGLFVSFSPFLSPQLVLSLSFSPTLSLYLALRKTATHQRMSLNPVDSLTILLFLLSGWMATSVKCMPPPPTPAVQEHAPVLAVPDDILRQFNLSREDVVARQQLLAGSSTKGGRPTVTPDAVVSAQHQAMRNR